MKLRFLLFFIFLAGLIFTRFYNIENTSRFTRDESYNLFQMHRIWQEKDITLIGPMDAGKTLIHPSMMFYMLLPFAIAGDFEPVSPAIGTAVYSVLTATLTLYLVYKLNKKFIFPVALLLIFWIPLVESGRWAWNPHLVPFTTVIALILLFKKQRFAKFLSGILLGASFHLHFFTAAATGVFVILKRNIYLLVGVALMILPFVIFDITHPPGLFFGHYLRSNIVSSGASNEASFFLRTFSQNMLNSLIYFAQIKIIAVALAIIVLLLAFFDIKHKKENLVYFLPIVAQIAGISFLPRYENRYLVLVIVFFIVWLVLPRRPLQQKLSKFAIVLLAVTSMFTLPIILTKPSLPPGTYIARLATNYISGSVKAHGHKNVNLAVLASPDPDPLGSIYRHTLQTKNIHVLLENQYSITDNLFVISTSDEKLVRNDPANLMQGFRNGKLAETYQIKDTDWKVYLFKRDE